MSAEIAAATETKAEYIKRRAFDKDHYKKMVVAHLEKFGEAKRQDIEVLLLDKLSDTLDEAQKVKYVGNLLQEMRRTGVIERAQTKRRAKWRSAKPRSKSTD